MSVTPKPRSWRRALEGWTQSRSEATGAARGEQLGGAKDLPQSLAMGYNREQRPDAALDVLAAGTAQAREEHKTPTVTDSIRHADWSINSSMSASRSAR